MGAVALENMTVEELQLLANEMDSESLVNTLDAGQHIPIESMSIDQLYELQGQLANEDKIKNMKADSKLEWYINQAKLGTTSSIALGAALQEQFMIKPWAHLLEGVFFGSGGAEEYQEKQSDMMEAYRNFYNSDEYRKMIMGGRNNDIKNKLQEIREVGGTAGLQFGEFLSNIKVPEIPFTENATYWEDFINSLVTHEESLAQITGAEPWMQGPAGAGLPTKAFGHGLRLATDPIMYTGIAGWRAAPKVIKEGKGVFEYGADVFKRKAANFLKKGSALFTIGSGATVGGHAGEKVEKHYFPERSGQAGHLVGAMVGGIGAMGAAVPSRMFWRWTGEKLAKRKYTKKYADSAQQAYVTGGVKGIYELMQKDITPERFNELVKEFKKLGHLVNKADMPLLVVAAESPTMQSELRRLLRANPGFHKEVVDEMQALSVVLERKADEIFGTRYSPVNLAEIPEQLQIQGEKLIKIRMNLERRMEELNLQFVPGATAESVGSEIKAIVAKREKIAREEMSPTYKEILADAEAAGAFMDEEAVRTIYTFVKENNLQDLFGRGTPLDNMIKAHLGPQVKLIKNAQGKVLRREKSDPILTFTQVDSLKRAINHFERQPLSRTEQRQLQQLKQVIKEQRETIPGDFNNRLIAADVLYYEKVGIPYSAEGIKQINSRKYAEEIYPVLFKNKSSLTQFLDVAGAEGQTIAQNAYLMKAYDRIFKNGKFDIYKTRALLKTDRDLLEVMPEVRQMLDDSILDQSALHLKHSAINNQSKLLEKEIANHFLISSGLSPNYPKLATKLIEGDKGFYNKIQGDLSKLDANTARIVNENIRREYITQIFSMKETPKSQGSMAYLLDPKNKNMVETIFGENPQFLETMHGLSKLSDSLKRINVVELSAKASQAEVDVLAKWVPGVTLQYAASQVRDRVSSLQMKAIRILTHVNQAKLQTRTDRGIMDLILHKDINKLNEWGKTFSWKVDSPGAAIRLKNIMAELLPAYMYAIPREQIREGQEPVIEERIIGEENR
jgi:hypothetical protein